MNQIVIKGLEVETHIGVPDSERSAPQRLLIDVTLTPQVPFSELQDDIAKTVDYDLATQRIAALAGDRPRRLIETLASEIAEMLVEEFSAVRADVEVRKFVLPQTEYVAVRCTRLREI
jgi:7,8-dihydroneopterin aldolase/epimerase/oxygenase